MPALPAASGGRATSPPDRAVGGACPHSGAPALHLPPAAQAETRAPHPGTLALGDEGEEGRSRYKKRTQTVEPVFGIIKYGIGFTCFRPRGRQKLALEWLLVTLAYNCRRLHN